MLANGRAIVIGEPMTRAHLEPAVGGDGQFEPARGQVLRRSSAVSKRFSWVIGSGTPLPVFCWVLARVAATNWTVARVGLSAPESETENYGGLTACRGNTRQFVCAPSLPEFPKLDVAGSIPVSRSNLRSRLMLS